MIKSKFKPRLFLQLFLAGITCILITSKSYSQIDTSLIGEWYGIVEQVNFGTYETRMKIENLTLNEPSGQTEYPPDCEADNIFLENIDSLHVFSETITLGFGCADGRVEIYKLDSDTIQWSWYFPNGTEVNTFGKLTRQTSTAIKNIENENLQYFSGIIPNPMSNEAKFHLTTKVNEKVKISLFDLNGKTVFSIFEGELQSHRENTFFIRSQGLVSGMYLLGIQGKTINRHERVMIVK